MLTKKDFYSKFKNKFANKHDEIFCIYDFECQGIQCELLYRLTSVFNAKIQKSQWYMSLQLINKRAEKNADKYICNDLYSKLVDLNIYTDYQAWKFIEKWIKTGVTEYLDKRINAQSLLDYTYDSILKAVELYAEDVKNNKC